MLQATMGGAEAGTKYKAFLRSATKGGEALGLKFTDANNQLLSMPEILDILRGKFGETMDAAEKMELQKAFGDTEAVALIDLMYNKVGDLQDNIVNMYGSLGKGVSVTEQMASAIQETEPERFERLKQRIHNVTESIGNSLLPTVNDLMSKGEGVLTKVGSWIEKNQELVKVIMLIVLAVGGFLAVGGTLIALISGVGLVVTKTVSAFKILKGGFALARGALTPLISSVWSFTAALLANPVTWVVIGIVALIAALVLLYNKCEWFRNAVNSVINFFKETLTAVGSVAKSVFEGIGNVIGSVMDAAKATVSEKLSNIKTAYEEHGGGISGVAAAAMEAVKGWYTAGYTFIDNLTGGKLSEIRGKFSTAMSNIVQGISQKFTDARTAFSNGLNNIKNAVSGAVTWFFESGKRIVSTFANGIKSAFSSAVEAVKGGLQKIRNLLPFSDAKEGPLSTLTLSGQRTMTTYAHGLTLAGDAPAAAMNKSLQQVQGALDRKPEKKVDLGGGKKDNEEGFILDVLQNYTTYDTFYQLNKEIEEDPRCKTADAKRQIARFVELHETNIAQRVEVIVEHFRTTVMPELGGMAKAMVITASRQGAVKYRQAFENYTQKKGYTDIKALVAFSGKVKLPDDDTEYSEASMNGFPEDRLTKEFDKDDYQVLLVANKYQTGFDQPKLCAMYVLKKLKGVSAVQTLSRLNRICPPFEKKTFVLDFANTYEDIKAAFAPYYTTTLLSASVTPTAIYDLEAQIDAYTVLDPDDIEKANELLYKGNISSKDKQKLTFYFKRAKNRIEQYELIKQHEIVSMMRHFVRFYEFLLQVSCFEDTDLHKKYNFITYLLAYINIKHPGGGYNLDGKIKATNFVQKKAEEHTTQNLVAQPVVKLPTAESFGLTEAKEERLSQIIAEINSRTGKAYDNDVAVKAMLQIRDILLKSDKLKTSARNNTVKDFEFSYFDDIDDALIEGLEQNQDFFSLLLSNDEIKRQVLGIFTDEIYKSLREA